MSDLITAPDISSVGGLVDSSVFPVTNSVGATLYKATGAEIKEAYGSNILGSNFSETATGSVVITAGYAIPDMDVTFTTSVTKNIRIDVCGLVKRVSGGKVRFALLINGVSYHPISNDQHFYSTDQGENSIQNYCFFYIISLVADTYTIQINADDAMAISGTDFWSRGIEVSSV